MPLPPTVTESPVKATMPGLDFSIKRDLFKINSTSDNIFMEILCSMTYMKMHFLKIIIITVIYVPVCFPGRGQKTASNLWNWSCRWLWGAAKMLGIEPLFSGGAAVLSVTEPSLQFP